QDSGEKRAGVRTRPQGEGGDRPRPPPGNPRRYPPAPARPKAQPSLRPAYEIGQEVATREAYGAALAKLGKASRDIVALDGDTKNSTFSGKLKEVGPEQFVDSYIAEQNMVGAAPGMTTQAKIPFAS